MIATSPKLQGDSDDATGTDREMDLESRPVVPKLSVQHLVLGEKLKELALNGSNEEVYKYKGYPLLQSIMVSETILLERFKEEGRTQIDYPKSRSGWLQTLFILRGRSLDLVALPFTLSVLHATLYCIVQEKTSAFGVRDRNVWENFSPVALNTTLSFLLVFRMNRAADRWWTARAFWGRIVAICRNMVSQLLTHVQDDSRKRDAAIRWILTTVIATMELLRGVRCLPKDNFAGLVCESDFAEMADVDHPPMYAVDQVRRYLRELFLVTADTPVGVAQLKIRHLNVLETSLNDLLDMCGGMERIKATPLPVVYVTHLRTFLMLALFVIPYAWGPLWGWATIPLVALTSFAWLGLEAAAIEAEYPFAGDRVNALDMASYCMTALKGIKQQLQSHADRELNGKNTCS